MAAPWTTGPASAQPREGRHGVAGLGGGGGGCGPIGAGLLFSCPCVLGGSAAFPSRGGGGARAGGAGGVAIGAAALGLWLAVHRAPLPVDRRSLTAFLIMGGLNNALPFSLIFMAQTEIAGGVAAILNATTPLFTAILASWLGMERLTAARIAGLLIGIAGV